MQLLMRRSWRKQQPTVHATWHLMDRSDSSRTPRSRTEFEGRTKAPQTLSSALSRWIHRLRVAHHRKSVFSGLSRSRLERIHSALRSTPSSIRRRCCATVDGGPHVYYADVSLVNMTPSSLVFCLYAGSWLQGFPVFPAFRPFSLIPHTTFL